MRNCCEVSSGSLLERARASRRSAGRGGSEPSRIARTVASTARTRDTSIFIAERCAVRCSATVKWKNTFLYLFYFRVVRKWDLHMAISKIMFVVNEDTSKYKLYLPKLFSAPSPEDTLATWSTPILSASSAASVYVSGASSIVALPFTTSITDSYSTTGNC